MCHLHSCGVNFQVGAKGAGKWGRAAAEQLSSKISMRIGFFLTFSTKFRLSRFLSPRGGKFPAPARSQAGGKASLRRAPSWTPKNPGGMPGFLYWTAAFCILSEARGHRFL